MITLNYELATTALGYVAVLMLVQVLVTDVLGIMRKHVPGSLVQADQSNPLFRASRTVGNTNESIAIFICALLFCMLVSASPLYTAYAAWAFALSRTAYAIFYYANVPVARSVSFGFSLLAIAALLMVGLFSQAA